MSTETGTTTPPAPGWYHDPQAQGRERWWSGISWTEYVRDASLPVPVAAPAFATAMPTTVQTDSFSEVFGSNSLPAPTVPPRTFSRWAAMNGSLVSRLIWSLVPMAFGGCLILVFWTVFTVAANAGSAAPSTREQSGPVAEAAVEADLGDARLAAIAYHSRNNVYPTTLAELASVGYAQSANTNYSPTGTPAVSLPNGGVGFCIAATASDGTHWVVTANQASAQPGVCVAGEYQAEN